VLQHLIDSERAAYDQDELRTLVDAMALTTTQKQALLDRLVRAG